MAGGLGNQLFQIYAGIFFSIKYERNLVLDYRNIGDGFTNRDDRVDFLNLAVLPDLKIVWGNKLSNLIAKLRTKVIRRIFRITKKNKSFRNLFVTEIGYCDIQNLENNRSLFGYFQSWRYVNFVESRIGSLEIIEDGRSQWFQNVITEIRTMKPIVIHLRRGDYSKLTETFGLLSTTYFENALKRAAMQTISRNVFVFSDDPERANEVFAKIQGFRFTLINPPPESKDYESMLLMGASKILIISNSTFSWWSAYLNKTPIVYCPDKWFKNMNDPIDLIPPQWIKIPSTWS